MGSEDLALDHVQLAAPPGCEAEARRFFGAVLGLEELEKLGETATSGGCWFRLGVGELHVGVEAEHRPARKAHPALRAGSVAHLERLAARIEAAGGPVRWDTRLPGVRRFFTEDPFGNRIELMAADPPGPAVGASPNDR